MRETSSILVAIDFDMDEGPDTAILVVGKKKKGKAVDIINIVQGEEGMELYRKLVGSE